MPAALQLPPSLVALTLDQGPQRWDQGSPPPLQLQGLTRLTTLCLRNFRRVSLLIRAAQDVWHSRHKRVVGCNMLAVARCCEDCRSTYQSDG